MIRARRLVRRLTIAPVSLVVLACFAVAGTACSRRADRGAPVATAPAVRRAATLAELESTARAGTQAFASPQSGTQAPTGSGSTLGLGGSAAPLLGTSPAGPTPARGPELVILHTNDNWGEAVPCG